MRDECLKILVQNCPNFKDYLSFDTPTFTLHFTNSIKYLRQNLKGLPDLPTISITYFLRLVNIVGQILHYGPLDLNCRFWVQKSGYNLECGRQTRFQKNSYNSNQWIEHSLCLRILIGYLCKELCSLFSPIDNPGFRKREHGNKGNIVIIRHWLSSSMPYTEMFILSSTLVQEDIHFAVMGHVEAALNSESGLNYGIVLEDESGPSFPLIVRVVKEALISLIQSHSGIRHNKEPA